MANLVCPSNLEESPDGHASPHWERDAELFEVAFRQAGIGMALVGLDGRFLRVNRALCELVGYSEEELLAQNFQAITHPDDLPDALESLSRFATGEITSYRREKRYRSKSGALVWVSLNTTLILDKAGVPEYFISQMQDMSERKRFETELQVRENEIKSIVEHVPDMIARYDRAGRVLYVNPAVENLTGIRPSLFFGRTLVEAGLDAASAKVIMDNVWETIRLGQTRQSRDIFRCETRSRYFLTMVPEVDRSGAIDSVLAISSEITEIHEAQERLLETQRQLETANAELRGMATHDDLTGLCNRRACDDHLTQEIQKSRRHDEPLSLVLMDIDHFKQFNDTHGHAAGDQVLREVARALESTVRPCDVVARYGGEEFAIVLAGTSLEGALGATERCRLAVCVAGIYGSVTASFGVATWDGESPEQLSARADLALYAAKTAGRNCVRYAG